jgi:DNA repair protein RecO (recombination protein O)
VTVFNRTFGKTSGLVRGLKIPIHPGDISDVSWNGRTAEQLGTFKIENIFSPFTYILGDSNRIFAVESASFLCSKGLPEKAPHQALFDSLRTLLLSIPRENWLINYALFEVSFLSEVGSGLDLSKCALSGRTENLFYISPRTGCAATKEAGEKYKRNLFVLPQFLVSKNSCPVDRDVFSALKITGHFLKMHFYGINNGKLPLSRDFLTAELTKSLKGVECEN